MLEKKIRAAASPTESEMQAMGRALYEELLSDLCTKQRASPYDADTHSMANLAYADYFDRMAQLGGRASLLPEEEKRLMAERGWDQQRIADLRCLIGVHDERGFPLIKPDSLDRQLYSFGYAPDDRLRWMLELVLYPYYRDAHLDAEIELRRRLGLLEPVSSAPASEDPEPIPEVSLPSGGPMSDFIDLAISDLAAEETWDAKSCRQARSTIALFELLIGAKPFVDQTQADYASFKRKISYLPKRYDMSSAKSREAVLKRIAEFEADPDRRKARDEQLSSRTRNRHLSSLSTIHRWARKTGLPAPAIRFEDLFIPESKARRARNERPATPLEDVQKLFALPIFTGCQPHAGGAGRVVLDARFAHGDAIMHDAFYWVPLLLYYTGARREELCKLQPEDVREEGGIPLIYIDFTRVGRVKNDHSVRPVPLHSELIRLGFLDFVAECRRRKYEVLFPELYAANESQGYGDVYYKNVWSNIRRKGELSDETTNHGMRHRFSTELKVKKVFSEFRRDLMGHAGANISEERYSELGPLIELRNVVEEMPAVTAHLIAAPMRLPPKVVRKPHPNKKRRKA